MDLKAIIVNKYCSSSFARAWRGVCSGLNDCGLNKLGHNYFDWHRVLGY